MMSLMSRCCSGSSFGATFAPVVCPIGRHGAGADRRCRRRSFIPILCDINMTGMSGHEALPKAKATRPDVPIIMITAHGDAETKREALEGGVEALPTKPIDFGTLLMTRRDFIRFVGGASAARCPT
jgi:CheY-like chemotaxis protein